MQAAATCGDIFGLQLGCVCRGYSGLVEGLPYKNYLVHELSSFAEVDQHFFCFLGKIRIFVFFLFYVLDGTSKLNHYKPMMIDGKYDNWIVPYLPQL
jgi:hypothetical protein